MALAVVFGVGGAVAVTTNSNANSKKRIIYIWKKVDANGNVIAGNDFSGTYAQAQAYYGCSGSTGRCAVATDGGDPSPSSIYIYKNAAN